MPDGSINILTGIINDYLLDLLFSQIVGKNTIMLLISLVFGN